MILRNRKHTYEVPSLRPGNYALVRKECFESAAFAFGYPCVGLELRFMFSLLE